MKKLSLYRKKRDFGSTPEPAGKTKKIPKTKESIFVIQKHDATRLHYDFRLEMDGVLKSWAVPKGPSLNPSDKRLAIETEDHPMDYAHFEGVIPAGNYGAGRVIIWDNGTYVNLSHDPRTKKLIPIQTAYHRGQIMVWLKGKKLQGAFVLMQIKGREEAKKPWLLIKMKDKTANLKKNLVALNPESVITGKIIEDMKDPRKRKIKNSFSG